MFLVAHAADWFMGIPVLAFLTWLLVVNVRDRLARRKDKDEPT